MNELIYDRIKDNLETAIHDKEQIMELATMRFVENRENVVFLGTPGVGKTHLAVSLGMIAASNRYSTHYFNCHELINILNKAQYENRLEEKLKFLAKSRVLIIDEIEYLPMDIQAANLFYGFAGIGVC